MKDIYIKLAEELFGKISSRIDASSEDARNIKNLLYSRLIEGFSPGDITSTLWEKSFSPNKKQKLPVKYVLSEKTFPLLLDETVWRQQWVREQVEERERKDEEDRRNREIDSDL